MKIDFVDDLHLEFAPLVIHNTNGADVLVMAGDICVAKDLERMDTREIMQDSKLEQILEFFETINTEYNNVIWVMGNHEHYHGNFVRTPNIIKDFLTQYNLKNIHLLNNDTFALGDIVFVGGTMWTNMNDQDPLTMIHIKDMMNDFHVIKNDNKVKFKVWNEILQREEYHQREVKFNPYDAVKEFYNFTNFLSHVIMNSTNHRYVVVTHHAPSFQCMNERYRNETLMNGGYMSSLDEYIMDHPQIKYWLFGHLHDPVDLIIGETRVMNSPRGYPGQDTYFDYVPKLLEL